MQVCFLQHTHAVYAFSKNWTAFVLSHTFGLPLHASLYNDDGI